jgi:hypothetical protein
MQDIISRQINKGNIQLTIRAIQRVEIKSVKRTTELYNCGRTILIDRMAERPAAIDLPAKGHKLTPNEEETLKAWLLDMDERGFPSTPADGSRKPHAI